ncbi:recombinase family protein [Enterococcus sp. AZ192]|uniref:recombinase family protein n=1 Tax=unclassified Enterococcus TaxID=2608891 RepID=UPI003D28A5CB
MEKPIKKNRLALYLRVSTNEQAQEGYSIQAQEQNGRDYAKRIGYEVTEVYADEGESGKSTKNRLAYQRMMADVQAEKFDLLVIWKLSRLGRNMLDILKTVDVLLEHNAGLYSISEQFDVTTSSGKLMLQLLGSFSEFERNQISENVQMAMTSLVRDQKRYAGGRRLGYVSGVDNDGKKQLLIEPKEAELVQLIYSKYLSGQGYRSIANELNKRGYQTVKGNSFSTTAIKDILHNKIYAGYLEYARYVDWDTKRRKGKNLHPIIVKGDHEPIIDEHTYQAVQERLDLESRHPNWNHAGENVLTGLLRCPECGAPMAASNVTNTLKDGTKKRIRYYSCSQFRNKGASVCHANSIRADQAEQFVAARLKEIVQHPQIIKEVIQALNQEMEEQRLPLSQELKVIQTEKKEITAKIEKLTLLLEEDPELLDSLKERLEKKHTLRREKQIRENELLSILSYQGKKIEVGNVTDIVIGIDKLVSNQEKQQIKQLYRTFIQKITFTPDTKDHLQLTMYFDQSIIDQLNKHYRETVSHSEDTVLFVLTTPFRFTV